MIERKLPLGRFYTEEGCSLSSADPQQCTRHKVCWNSQGRELARPAAIFHGGKLKKIEGGSRGKSCAEGCDKTRVYKRDRGRMQNECKFAGRHGRAGPIMALDSRADARTRKIECTRVTGKCVESKITRSTDNGGQSNPNTVIYHR